MQSDSTNRWSENNLPSAQDVETAKSTMSRLTQGGELRNSDFIEWVDARLTVDWAAAAQPAADEGRAR